MGGMLGLIECYIILTVHACIQAWQRATMHYSTCTHANVYAHPISEQDIAMEEVLHIVQRRLTLDKMEIVLCILCTGDDQRGRQGQIAIEWSSVKFV